LGDSEVTLRFAPYIENKHVSAMDEAVAARTAVIDNSPYAAYSAISADDAFLGVGIILSSFSSMYDTFGKHLSGLDIDSLFTNAIADKIADTETVVKSEIALLDDSIDQAQEQKLLSRSLNSSNSSTFVIAQANIERNRIKKTTEFRLAVKYSLIPGVVETWVKTLSWDKSLVTQYAKSLKDYYLCRINSSDYGYKIKSNDALWPINVLGYELSMIAAMTGSSATNKVMTPKERSDLSKGLLVASYTATGAQIGSSIVPGWGTVIGGVVGFVVGIGVMLLE